MDKIAFTVTQIEGQDVLVCAHERDYDGKGTYIARDAKQFDNLSLQSKVECINDMIVALINHVEVKESIKFSDYVRKEEMRILS